MSDVAMTKWGSIEQRKHNNRKLGTFGAASPVRRINPKTGRVIE
jgi:hypothetical protein